MKNKDILLNNGKIIPQVGFGTWQLEGDEVKPAIQAALDAGYRHFDTAQIYNNEYEIGDALTESRIPRNELFITSKVWISNFTDEFAFKESVKESLARLNTNYVDLMLLHWAVGEKITLQAYKWLEDICKKGLAKSIGVSNFNIKRLTAILEMATIKPVVNQIKFDPINQQHDLRIFCYKNKVHIQGYSLLRPYLGVRTQNELSETQHALIDDIAKKHGKKGTQVIIKWAMQQGIIIFPKSRNPERIKSNFDVFNFHLNENELETIDAMFKKLPQQMDEVANGLWNNALKTKLLYKRRFIKNDDETFSNDNSFPWERSTTIMK